MTPEGKELKAFKAFLKAAGLSTIRLALMPGVERGWPDTVVLLPGGMALWIELKAPAKTPNPTQVVKLERLSELGFVARFFDNAPEACEFVYDCLRLLSLDTGNPHHAAQVSAMGAVAVYVAGRRVPGYSSIGGATPPARRA